MKYLLLSSFFTLFLFTRSYSQTTLFDDSRVSSVYVEISPDSLAVIMTDVLSDHYFQAMFIYDYGTGRDTLQNIGFRLRGNTSRLSQKKSFKISFNEYVSGRKYQGVKKINLNGQHNDPTMVREKLFYDSWNKAGMAERRTSFVKLYINHIYRGLYTNLEELDKDWLLRAYGDNGGNLYKCTYPADMVYHNTNQQTYKDIHSGATTGGRAYDLQTNETLDDYTDLVELITLLNRPADSLFAVQIAQKLNVDGLLKAFAIDVATGDWDGYMYNKNNYFFYHRTDNGKFEYIAYDTDNTFGVDWVHQDWTTRSCLKWYNQTESRPLAKKILSVPAFMSRYVQYLDTISHTIVNPNVIFAHIDSLKTLIYSAAIADNYRSLDFGYTLDNFNNGFIQTVDSHTPYGIKPFLTKRYNYTMQQIATASVFEIPGNGFTFSIYPNPASELLTLKIAKSLEDRQCYTADMMGRIQKSFILAKNQDEYMLQVATLKPGVYSLGIVGSANTGSKLFIKK